MFIKRKGEKSKEKAELKEEKKEEKAKKSNSNPVKLRSNIGIRILRIFVWGIFILFFIRGVIAIVRPDPVGEMQQLQKKFETKVSENNVIEGRAFSYAESFARDYFTLYQGKYEDYKTRLSKYMRDGEVNGVDTKGNMEVQSVTAYDVKRYSDNQLDVYVHAIVVYRTEKPGQEEVTDPDMKSYDTSLKDVYMDVPIYYNENREMVVEDLPIFIGGPAQAALTDKEIENLNTVTGSKMTEIKNSISEFFKAYYQESQTQVDYFLEKPGVIKATGSQYKFEKLNDSQIYDLGGGKYKAVVSVNVIAEGKTFRQNMNMNLIYQGDRYMIQSLETRSKNIK